jgi:hypothetical protein
MVRRSVLAMVAVMAIVLGGVVVSTPAGAVVDSATIVPSPSPGTSNDGLVSVSCVSASDCVAVGYTDTGNNIYETLVMVWDGTVWSIVSSPNAGTSDDALYSVSCVSAWDCVAVGYTDTGNNIYETLVLSLTGPVPPSTTTTTLSPDQVVPAFTG